MFYRVNSNLEHNGVKYAPKSFVEETPENFETLVQDGIVEALVGVNSMEEAEVVAKELDEAREKARLEAEGEVAAAEGENTWGPTAEKPEAPAEEVKTEEVATDGTVDTEVKTEEVKEPAPGEVGTGDQAPTGDNL